MVRVCIDTGSRDDNQSLARIQNTSFVSDEHSINYGCIAVARKQREAGRHSLLLVGLQQCVRSPLAQLVCLQVKPVCFIRNPEASVKLTAYSEAVPLYSCLHYILCVRIPAKLSKLYAKFAHPTKCFISKK